MGICKVLRRYMTQGREEKVKGDKKKQVLIKQKTWINDCSNLTSRLNEIGKKKEEHITGDDMSLKLQERLQLNISKNVTLKFRGKTIEGPSDTVEKKQSMVISRRTKSRNNDTNTLGPTNSESQYSNTYDKPSTLQLQNPKLIQKKQSMAIKQMDSAITVQNVSVSSKKSELPKHREKLELEKISHEQSNTTLATTRAEKNRIIGVNKRELESMIRSNTQQKNHFGRIFMNSGN